MADNTMNVQWRHVTYKIKVTQAGNWWRATLHGIHGEITSEEDNTKIGAVKKLGDNLIKHSFSTGDAQLGQAILNQLEKELQEAVGKLAWYPPLAHGIEAKRQAVEKEAGGEPKRIKRITSHSGLARYLANDLLQDAGDGGALWMGEIPRLISSRFAYSPTHVVYQTHKGKNVFIVETAHKRYDVFEVPASLKIGKIGHNLDSDHRFESINYGHK